MARKRINTLTTNETIKLPETTEEPCNADLLPEFHEAIPTPDKLNTEGCKALAAAIIARAAYDYYDVCLQPDNESNVQLATNESIPVKMYCDKAVIEHFIDSKWYDCLTNIPPRAFREVIKERRREGLGMGISMQAAAKMKTGKRSKYTVNPKELENSLRAKTIACNNFGTNGSSYCFNNIAKQFLEV